MIEYDAQSKEFYELLLEDKAEKQAKIELPNPTPPPKAHSDLYVKIDLLSGEVDRNIPQIQISNESTITEAIEEEKVES